MYALCAREYLAVEKARVVDVRCVQENIALLKKLAMLSDSCLFGESYVFVSVKFLFVHVFVYLCAVRVCACILLCVCISECEHTRTLLSSPVLCAFSYLIFHIISHCMFFRLQRGCAPSGEPQEAPQRENRGKITPARGQPQGR